MKTCPICKATLFDDMEVCYGCMHRFDDCDGEAGVLSSFAGEEEVGSEEVEEVGDVAHVVFGASNVASNHAPAVRQERAGSHDPAPAVRQKAVRPSVSRSPASALADTRQEFAPSSSASSGREVILRQRKAPTSRADKGAEGTWVIKIEMRNQRDSGQVWAIEFSLPDMPG